MTDVSRNAKRDVSSTRRANVEENEPSDTKDIALSTTAFLLKIVGLWFAKNRKEERTRYLTVLYTMLAITYGIVVQFRDFYYSWPNYSDCTYTACNILSLLVVLFKLSMLFAQRTKFIDMLDYAYKNFWHSNYDHKEMALLRECRRISFISISLINFCAQASVLSYILTPIVANIGKNESERILPFNMRLDVSYISMSPYYEIFFTIQVLSLYHVVICYVCFDSILCLVNLHAAAQFRILQYRFLNFGDSSKIQPGNDCDSSAMSKFVKECRVSFNTYVRQHQRQISYCQRLNELFTIIVLGHLILETILFCLVGYQILVPGGSTMRRLIFVFHLIGALFLMFLFTYSCTGLIQESMNIGTAIYCGPWIHLPMNKIGASLRKDLRMVIIRSGKPCCITAAGFFPISVETFTTVLSTATSYLTILRQSLIN